MLTLGIWTIQRERPSPRFSPSSIYVSRSNNKFLFLQALPTFLIKTGTATLLPKPFCHSVTVFNKTLLPVFPIFPNCFICLRILFFPIHSGDVSHIGSFSRLLQSKKWYVLKDKLTLPFSETRIIFPLLPLSLSHIGCESKSFSRLLTCAGEMMGEFCTSYKMNSSGSHSSMNSYPLAWLIHWAYLQLFQLCSRFKLSGSFYWGCSLN